MKGPPLGNSTFAELVSLALSHILQAVTAGRILGSAGFAANGAYHDFFNDYLVEFIVPFKCINPIRDRLVGIGWFQRGDYLRFHNSSLVVYRQLEYHAILSLVNISKRPRTVR